MIRGSWNWEDWLTSMTFRPTSLEELGTSCGFDGTNRYAHGGFLTSTKWIYDDIHENGILEKLLLDKDSKFSNYRLRITGHSFGAACAAILSILLRPVYPDLRCHCFATPGGTLSENAAIECEEYLTSYVNDSDIIPRACMESLENLRYDVVDMIARIKVPKNDVICCYGRKYGHQDAKVANDQVLYSELETPDSELKTQWHTFNELYQNRKEERDFPDVELFPPGKLVHIINTSTHATKSLYSGWCQGTCRSTDDQYVSRWATRLDFREIRISAPDMAFDHDSMTYLQRFEHEAQRFGLVAPYFVNDYADEPSQTRTRNVDTAGRSTDDDVVAN